MNTSTKPDSNLPQTVYVAFETGSGSDEKAFSYLGRLDENLKDKVKIERQILSLYPGPYSTETDLPTHYSKVSGSSTSIKVRGFGFFLAAYRKIQFPKKTYWFSNLDPAQHEILKWMQNWNHSNAKAVFFVQTLDTGLRLSELTFLYAKNIPTGIIVILVGKQSLNTQKLRSLEKWGIRVLLDASNYSASGTPLHPRIPLLHFDSLRKIPLSSSEIRNINWIEELSAAHLVQRNPEKVLFVRPDWTKCGSATTFGKMAKLFHDRGAILIDIALQPHKVPYNGITIQRKLAEVENDIAPSFHFNLRRGSLLHALLAIGIGYLRTWPKTVSGFMPLFYKQCVTPAAVRKLIADARIDYLYVNHYFTLPVAQQLCPNRPIFLDTHDIQSFNFVSHDYHRYIHMRAAPFSACLDEELSFIDRADCVTMVSRDEINLASKYRPARNFFYYIPLPSEAMQLTEEQQDERHGENAPVSLLIVASRNPANERSLKWFLNVVWPAIIKMEAHLEIVGGISKSFAGEIFENVTFHGIVDDISCAYRQADVILLPITNGGGIAIKALEAIQYGKPIVATRHALRGLPAAIYEVLSGCVDEEDFVTDLSNLIASTSARKQREAAIHQIRDILISMRFDDQMHATLDRMQAAGQSIVGKQASRIVADSNPSAFTFQPSSTARRRDRKAAMRYVVVTPASPGSKGDEGMVRGCLSLLANSAEFVMLNPDRSPLWSDAVFDKNSSRPREYTGAFSKFYSSITQHDVFIVLGADVIDGTCGLEPSLKRLKLIEAALAVGAAAHVFCSFRSDVNNQIITQLKQIRNAHFYLRDLHSLKRFKDQTGLEAEYFPDFFIYCPRQETDRYQTTKKLLAEARIAGKTIIGLNFSEHAFRSFSDIHDYTHRKKYVADVLASLCSTINDPYFLLISHDDRRWNNFPPDSDYQHIAQRWLKANGYRSSTSLLDPHITYPQILSLLDGLDMVISGRMHLALAAFRCHVIPICLMGTGRGYSSADKMRGIFDKFIGRTELVPSNTTEFISALKTLSDQNDVLKARLKESLLVIEKESIEKKNHFQKKLTLAQPNGTYRQLSTTL